MEQFIRFLENLKVKAIVILVDSNIERLYPHYWHTLHQHFLTYKIVVSAGESSKSIEQVVAIWQELLEHAFEKDVFILNFGGGMICDLGGFVASTYKRGVRFANCPTTLLSMIDAAIGGKNGINIHHVKNCVGLIRQPDFILPADTTLLKTLPETELKSGFGEMIKYALIGNKPLFEELMQVDQISPEVIKPEWIEQCVSFKQKIVEEDPNDLNKRHILNFGHTFGHALEGYYAEVHQPIPHGYAVAVGMLYEGKLSQEFGTLPKDEYVLLDNLIRKYYDVPTISEDMQQKLLTYLRQDKKNSEKNINFARLLRIGEAEQDFLVDFSTLADFVKTLK